MMRERDREKFVRLANRRVNRAIKVMQLIGNLSNKSNYDYTAQDVEAIFQALRTEVQRCEEMFVAARDKRTDTFQLE